MDRVTAERWVGAYGEAWQARDAGLAGLLFTDEATYQWTPFDEPLRGLAAITQSWADATATQRDVRFSYRILGTDGDRVIAHWTSRFTRHATGAHVEIDGILVAELTPAGQCRRFREWWHALEPAGKP